MLRRSRRSSVVGLATSHVGQNNFIEHVVSGASEQRHGGQPGGSLTMAVNIVVLAHGRSMRQGRPVRISLWVTPTKKHIEVATAAAEAHGFKLEAAGAKAFIVEKVVEEAASEGGQEAEYPLAS
jgi:hypothetical protein